MIVCNPYHCENKTHIIIIILIWIGAYLIENFLNFLKLTQLLSLGQILRPLGP